MTAISERTSREVTDARALERIKGAAATLRAVKERRDSAARSAAEGELRRAVQAANERGLSWQTIGEALGVARGSAYQRYRRRPEKGTTVDQSGIDTVDWPRNAPDV